jgi:hypothetical protein
MRLAAKPACLGLIACTLLMGGVHAAESCGSSASAPAQLSTVKELLQVTGVYARARTDADRVVAQLRSQNPRVPGTIWEKYAASIAAPDSVTALYAPIYAHHLSDDELRRVLSFYRSGAGAPLLAAMPAMQAEARNAAMNWVIEIAGDLSDSGSLRTPLDPSASGASAPVSSQVQVSRRTQRVHQLLTLSGTISQAQQMMNDLIDRFEAAPQGAALTRTMWEHARSRLTNEADLIELWTPAYQHHLSDREVGALLGFYQSATGRCLVSAMPEVQKEAVDVATQLGRDAVNRATREVLGPLPQWALDHQSSQASGNSSDSTGAAQAGSPRTDP